MDTHASCKPGDPQYREGCVTHPLRHHPDIKVGDVLPDRKVDIRHRWYKFDGNVPHCALDQYGSSRISIVYFCHRRWLNSTIETQSFLRDLGIPFPEETYMASSTSKRRSASSSLPKVGSSSKTNVADLALVVEDSDSESEADEEEGDECKVMESRMLGRGPGGRTLCAVPCRM